MADKEIIDKAIRTKQIRLQVQTQSRNRLVVHFDEPV